MDWTGISNSSKYPKHSLNVVIKKRERSFPSSLVCMVPVPIDKKKCLSVLASNQCYKFLNCFCCQDRLLFSDSFGNMF